MACHDLADGVISDRRAGTRDAWPAGLVSCFSVSAVLAFAELKRGLTAYRNQPERRSQRHTSGCHHGRLGRNAGGQPAARHHCTGNETRWK